MLSRLQVAARQWLGGDACRHRRRQHDDKRQSVDAGVLARPRGGTVDLDVTSATPRASPSVAEILYAANTNNAGW